MDFPTAYYGETSLLSVEQMRKNLREALEREAALPPEERAKLDAEREALARDIIDGMIKFYPPEERDRIRAECDIEQMLADVKGAAERAALEPN